MLILTRRAQQSIVLHLPNGDEIRVMLTEASAGRARIGIDAPQNVHVARAELPGQTFHRKRREAKSPAYDNGCSICRDPNCQDPCGKH